MPLFEYICRDCDTRFEALVTPSRPAACPNCQGDDLAKQHSVFAVASKSAASTMTAAPGACGTCGDPRGPGSCSLN
jgi:putative FmdB family regulatory protein